jgi:hypothetical protein
LSIWVNYTISILAKYSTKAVGLEICKTAAAAAAKTEDYMLPLIFGRKNGITF